ncbi:ABC transporter permease [Amycolatopsis regifaucium]|uniref:Peptide ABC transporter permease n=1 Tax=Amycolatopsis regifaucium TaxID=546365 RepID=A0A154MQK2_9PSEU|nr:ABC transporter permease [Amycolatopsis regifaucium]KZB86087.1 peptide ABC transporter permease [Amycolatopsis regifaucium]OKA04980.1 peptide ABC transporter permease [Amycolatopsis regifaucium]SFH77401.1 peptide/nickel transport system permease protein [Amycolatopsis regifaucium]
MAVAVAPAGLRGNPWLSFAVRRLGRFAVSLWVLVTTAFLMLQLVPGDPVRAALGLTAPVELVNARREALGLNDPLWLQYVHYVGGLFSGDFGTSMTSGQPVSEVIGDRLPATLQLALPAFAVVIGVAIPLGVLFAVLTRGGRRRGGELAFTTTTVLLAAVPEFLLAVALVAFFAVQLGWFPVAGSEGAGSLVLPVIALALGPASVLSRIVRVETLSVLGNDFIRTARAKRLPARLVYLRHALPNALTATLTMGGLMLTGMVAGTVLVENVFAWPGLGSTIAQSILQKDYPLVQGIVLVYGIGVLLVNLTVDVLLAVLDPRSTIRES